MGETVIAAVVDAVETTGLDIMTIGAAIIVSIGLAMMAYRYVRRITGGTAGTASESTDIFDEIDYDDYCDSRMRRK